MSIIGKLSKAFNRAVDHANHAVDHAYALTPFTAAALVAGIVLASPFSIAVGAVGTVAGAILVTDEVLLAKTGRPLFDRYDGDNSYSWKDIGNALKKAPGKAKNKSVSGIKKVIHKIPGL